ncbi:hypothetical protein ABF176_000529 [Flavobacterium psychrophilum]|uniref:hypothetical protein n=1 Tax=Flavobacterium psychrophilum TaxID=96345 RepID=UPI001068F1C9|nr:hypothetical protein [Flavobacterium psychrophilum]MCB6231617.1 hypothetical protein [Flavobacterium psychrophilum]
MKKVIYTVFLLGILLLLAFGTALVSSNNKVVFELVSKNKKNIAGHSIKLEFYSKSEKEKPQLFIVHSYGKTILDATLKKGNYVFKLPLNYCQKTGNVSWFLINQNETINSGIFEILPNDKTKTVIENYLGPRTILAGAKEFTMMVTVPTDSLDNPKEEDTEIILKHQFLQNITNLKLKTKNFIAWYDIFSPTKSGKMLVSSECNAIETKEIETEVYPNLPTNFTINYTRNHDFADGNQITHFTTSVIKDKYGNIASNGTMITFIIKTKKNIILKTFGTTINGIAIAQILHPDHQEIYSVKAFIMGIAESNLLFISYKPILSSFNYLFTNKNRTIKIGPIKSFMNQIAPDGIKVILKIFNQNILVATLQEDTSKGMATFQLSQDFFTAKSYRFEIIALGIIKKTETINYELHK